MSFKRSATCLVAAIFMISALLACGADNTEPAVSDTNNASENVTSEQPAPEDTSEKEEADRYTFICQTPQGDPVSDVRIQICTDERCAMITSDDDGIAEFDGEPADYDVHVLSVPEGYSLISDKDFKTTSDYATFDFTLEKE